MSKYAPHDPDAANPADIKRTAFADTFSNFRRRP